MLSPKFFFAYMIRTLASYPGSQFFFVFFFCNYHRYPLLHHKYSIVVEPTTIYDYINITNGGNKEKLDSSNMSNEKLSNDSLVKPYHLDGSLVWIDYDRDCRKMSRRLHENGGCGQTAARYRIAHIHIQICREDEIEGVQRHTGTLPAARKDWCALRPRDWVQGTP